MKQSKHLANIFTEPFLIQPPSQVTKIAYNSGLPKDSPLAPPLWSGQWRLWEGCDATGAWIWTIYCPYQINGCVKKINPALTDNGWVWEITMQDAYINDV